jgi:hypothetical protein
LIAIGLLAFTLQWQMDDRVVTAPSPGKTPRSEPLRTPA